MNKKYILSLDQGTTSSRAVLFDTSFNVIGIEQAETTQIFPNPGWVEQDPEEILETQIEVVKRLVSRLEIEYSDIATIGITNQRETTVVWDKKTGKPIYNAIIWQDTRTSEFCSEINKEEISEYIKKSTGLVIDSYFSATKLVWILNNVKGVKEKIKNQEILFGTIDTWLIWNLSGGELHITDYSNASRTLLFNIYEKKWDSKILQYFDIPESLLPKIVDSADSYGVVKKGIFGEHEIKISGIAGDQQSALFGQACFTEGEVKNTYGTGCFMLMNTGSVPFKSNSGLLTTIAWSLNGKTTYALEGSVFIAGAAIQWLRDKLKLINTAPETEKLALEIKDTGGVYFVPAFSGLGAPFWDMEARGVITGLTASTDYRHIVRASLEAIAYQTKDVLSAMQKDTNIKILNLNVDGGASANNFLLQFQADILNIEVNRPKFVESTALGVAFLAALGAGIWKLEELKQYKQKDKVFYPNISDAERNKLCSNWHKAVEKSKEKID